MPVYTVHEPPLRSASALADTERYVFVRDGFRWWAFLLTPLWMLRHRLWLVLVIYLVVTAALDGLLRGLGSSVFLIMLTGVLISLLIGFEASTLRRYTLTRRHWRNVGVVSGDGLEDAEQRFFAAWVHDAARSGVAPPMPPSTSPPPASPPSASPPSAVGPDAPAVVGLFPEPGALR
ncbi:MAG: DUF2628 domain-containing protein [Xanthobacteraceae bacterium]